MASGLSRRKFKVLAIDCDAQGNFSKASVGEDDVVGTFDILTGKEKVKDAIQELSEYDLVGGDKRLSSIDVALSTPGREYRLKKALERLEYDYCVIDNPPALNVAVANSLAASDKVIICSSAEAFSVDGLMEISATLDEVREYMNPGLKVDGILATMQLERIAEVMKTKVYKTFIRRCNTISVSQSERKSVFDYPSSNAAIDYGNFVEEFLS